MYICIYVYIVYVGHKDMMIYENKRRLVSKCYKMVLSFIENPTPQVFGPTNYDFLFTS